MDIWSGNSNQDTTGTLVAIIDDGLRYTHPDFTGQLRNGINCLDDLGSLIGSCTYGFDMFENDKDPLPSGSDTHGTHIAGII